MRLQLESLESPSELGNARFRNLSEIEVMSPMTNLALNLSDATLGTTPVQDSKRRLSMDSGSSASSESPSPRGKDLDKSDAPPSTPLSTITNRPKRPLQLGDTRRLPLLKMDLEEIDPNNKENFAFSPPPIYSGSPRKNGRSPFKMFNKSPSKHASPSKLSYRPSPAKPSPSKLSKNPPKPKTLSPLKCLDAKPMSPPKRSSSVKRPSFEVLDESDKNACESVPDSICQSAFNFMARKRSKPDLGSIKEICDDAKDEGIDGFAPLQESPKQETDEKDASEKVKTDGFDVELDWMSPISEKSDENDSPVMKFGFTSLLSNKIVLPSDLEDKPAFSQPDQDENSGFGSLFSGEMNLGSLAELSEEKKAVKEETRRPSFGNLGRPLPPKRPQFRRALSMLDEPNTKTPFKGSPNSIVDFESPVSRHTELKLISANGTGFKRPNPPKEGVLPLMNKRQKFNPSSLLGERSISLQESKSSSKPKFMRSHSANDLGIMKYCQQKEEMENILPDGSRLYGLPTMSSGSKHPNLRSMTSDTLADVVNGKHKDIINSCRIIDARYAFEFEGGHIKGAENWQHGEDDTFLKAFLPEQPLTSTPTLNLTDNDKRDILVFHCEFSSQRGPDFYNKLRESDRNLNMSVYPALVYPECYLLHLGYKEFYKHYPELCTGRYTEMVDPRHKDDLTKMRAKSKSWSGGTVARTGRMGRLHL